MTESQKAPARRVVATAFLANLLVLGVLGFAALIETNDSDLYYRFVQEDEWLEWASFWAFAAAGVVFVWAAVRQWKVTAKLPWFFAGVALFCWFVALEEISWGQRLLGYRPPEYFLAENFQQELNIHNVMATKVRMTTVKGVILGYGVVLPVLALLPGIGKGIRRLGIDPPPVWLAPAFLATYFTYEFYPWSHTGEWVEMTLGLGFLFAALVALRRYPSERPSRLRSAHPAATIGVAFLVVLGLGLANAAAYRYVISSNPDVIAATRAELEALKEDFVTAPIPTKCGLHKRLYTFKEKYDRDYLLEGAFSRLQAQGLPQARAEYFLDPWNSPYWLRSKCNKDRSRIAIFVYSFGPNRRRDSVSWEILDDDIGAYIVRLPPP